ncbi:MAG: ATP-binding protein [Bacteroidales bacterium]
MSDRAWHRSLYWRIALGFILCLAVVLVAQGILFLWLVARADGALPSRSLVDIANVVAEDLGGEVEDHPDLDVSEYIDQHYGQMIRRVSVFMGGRVYATHGGLLNPEAVTEASRQWEARGAPQEVERLPLSAGRFVAFAHVTVRGRVAGFVAVQPGGPSSRVLREILPEMLVIALALMLAGTVLAAALIFSPTNRRLKSLEDAARRLGAGQLDARVPVGGGDEITAVARAFNRMADDLAQRAAELRASDEARRQLLADVSHELMTPLTAIRGYVETLALPGLDLDAPTRQRYLAIVEQDTLKLEAIVGDLLDLARLSAGGGTLRLQEVSVRELFDGVLARHERQCGERHVRMTATIDAGAEHVTADKDRLEQALQNLAVNALRHTPPGGRVELRATAVGPASVQTSERQAEKRRVVLQVRDTGEGIPPEHVPHIFDRFYKVDAARTGSTAGSGLGLSIVKAIVERHGGTIAVTSTPGVETVFEIRL